MKIAICGTRGIPACYGGFETFAEELSTRLVARGHEVCVYGRSHVIQYKEKHYKGVEIRLLPAPQHKYLETPLHSLFSFLHLILHRTDIVLVCNAANSPFIWILRLFGLPTLVNLDGIERKRAKWNAVGRAWYRLGEATSVWFASKLIADAKVIQDYYRQTYQAETTVIAYGYRADQEETVKKKLQNLPIFEEKPAIYTELGIEENKYILYVSRLEPENHAHTVIQAYEGLPEGVKARWPLVIVGDAPYAKDYIANLHSMSGPRVLFAGYRFGADYTTLQLGATIYIQATEVGGTHPALVEAMGYGNCIIANQTPENEEVVGGVGVLYRLNDSVDLREAILKISEHPEEIQALRKQAYNRAQERFNWDKICSDYVELFQGLHRPTTRPNGRS